MEQSGRVTRNLVLQLTDCGLVPAWWLCDLLTKVRLSNIFFLFLFPSEIRGLRQTPYYLLENFVKM